MPQKTLKPFKMLALVFKNFMRSKGTKIGLLFLLLVGLISILIGKQFQDKQKANKNQAIAYQKVHIDKNVAFHKDDLGLLLYYLKFSIANDSNALNGLSIGQRDVNPAVQSITIRGIEGQKYDTELNNPNSLLLGNIDFSFVLIYLFPLLIIAFCYNIISEEKESGTWKIVILHSKNTFVPILNLFFVRALSLVTLLNVLIFIAVSVLKIPFNLSFIVYFSLANLYLIFWFCVCFFVASLQKQSNFNAVVLLSIWLLLVIILPSAINTFAQYKYPIPEALSLTLKQRNAYHEKWDRNKQETVDKFYTHYPQFKKYPLPDKQFSWLWYYAMQQMGDDESAIQTKELESKLLQRNSFSKTVAAFIPSLHTQIQLNELAKSDLENQLLFLKATTSFHEKLRLQFYSKIFENHPVDKLNWNNFKVETFKDDSKIRFWNSMLPVFGLSLVLILLGLMNFRNSKKQSF